MNIVLLLAIILLFHVQINPSNNNNNNNNDNPIFTIKLNKITIPQEEHVFICEGFTVPQLKEGGIIKISPAIDNQMAQSVRLFSCDLELPPGPLYVFILLYSF